MERNYQCLLANDLDFQQCGKRTLNKTDIDRFYNTICEKLTSHAKSIFPKKRFKRFLKPYSSADLLEVHRKMETARENWCRGDDQAQEHGRGNYLQNA